MNIKIKKIVNFQMLKKINRLKFCTKHTIYVVKISVVT